MVVRPPAGLVLPCPAAVLGGQDGAAVAHGPAAAPVGGKLHREEVVRRAAGLGLPSLAAVLGGQDGAAGAHGPAAAPVGGKLHREEVVRRAARSEEHTSELQS